MQPLRVRAGQHHEFVGFVGKPEAFEDKFVASGFVAEKGGLDFVEVVLSEAVQAVFATHAGKFEDVPADVNRLFVRAEGLFRERFRVL